MRDIRLMSCVLCLSVFALANGGCRDSSGGVSVHGKLTYRGAPLDKAAVTFFPVKGRPIGASVANGEYTVTLPPDDYVAVVALEPEFPPSFKEGDPTPTPKIALPDQYTNRAKSTLKATVAAGQAEPIDFDLK